MIRRVTPVLLTLGALLLALGCRGAPPAPDGAPLTVRFAGCAELRADGTCELDAHRTLTVWVATPADAALRVEADGTRLAAAPRRVRGGTQLRIPIPAGTRRLSVSEGSRTFVLSLRSTKTYPELERARALSDGGKPAEAAELLAQLADSPDRELGARALARAGRLALRQGDIDRALAWLDRSRSAAKALGMRDAEAHDLLAIAYIHEYLRFTPERARRALEGVAPDLASCHAEALYHRAVIAFLTGDARTVLSLGADVDMESERIGLDALRVHMGEIVATQLAELGRYRELEGRRRELLALSDEAPCERARLLVNFAWIDLLARGGDVRRARDDSAQAAELHASACSDARTRQNAQLNVAFAEFRMGDVRAARDALRQALALGPIAGWVNAWVFDLEGQLALADGRPRDALAIYRELAQRAEFALAAPARYRAELGTGRAQAALGELRLAAAAFQRAEDRLDDELRQVPLAEGRDVFVGERDESARELVGALLTLGDPEGAMLAARRARVRALRTLAVRSQLPRESTAVARWRAGLEDYRAVRAELVSEDRDAWTIPLSELAAFQTEQAERRRKAATVLDAAFGGLDAVEGRFPAPAEGVLLWTAHPLPRGWVLFAQNGETTRAVRIDELPRADDASAQSAALLEPFADLLDHARSLRVIPYGPLKTIDFHALPWRGAPLFEQLPVSYGSDLGVYETEPARADSALVVSDPSGNLPHARREGVEVTRLLRARGKVHSLVGERATHGALLAQLAVADLFHFAGHADFDDGGWQSGLRLADSTHLEPGDVLALARVPAYVVLSGCETMRENEQVAVASLGLAQAFLARGARAVVATTRPVPDSLGETLSSALFEGGRKRLDPAGFREVLQAVRRADATGSHWASYRLLVP